jgi:hypothetical protein
MSRSGINKAGRTCYLLNTNVDYVGAMPSWHGDAAPKIRDVSELMPPHVPVEKNAVHQLCHRPAVAFHVVDRSRRRGYLPLIGKEVLADHVFFSGCDSRSFCAHSSQQTSTVRVPILTLIALSSSLQLQAAQVFSAIIVSP